MLGNEDGVHRCEIGVFAKIVRLDNVIFHSISYQELIIKLNYEFYKGNEKYLDYMTDINLNYFCYLSIILPLPRFGMIFQIVWQGFFID